MTAAAIGAIGVVALARTTEPREIPLAAVPLFFALQQFVEGLLWLNLSSSPNHGAYATHLTSLYLVFAEVLWPVVAQAAVLLVEPSVKRRLLMLICLA
ncbi:MAG: DUF6629 family protein, partial [Alphaproteobacteria bacterium]